MPILPAEPDLWPPNLWDLPGNGVVAIDGGSNGHQNGHGNGNGNGHGTSHEIVRVIDPERPWWCAHTKPRQEKAIARDFRIRGITFYLPQVIEEKHTPGGRLIRSQIPLFSGYVFFQANEDDRLKALRTDRLVQLLKVIDQDRLVADLKRVHQVLKSGLPVKSEPIYPVGMKVRILTGPLQGVVGTVVRRGKQDRFVATVDFIQRGASVLLEDWQVEPAA